MSATIVKKGIYDWTSQDHGSECVKARTTHERANETAKAAGKPVKPFVCVSDEGCCPDDIIVNAGVASIIIGAQAAVPQDSPRVDVGDRRQGPFYVALMGKPGMVGLQRVKNVPIKRVADLEKIRKQRTGEIPADWIIEARKRTAAGGGPSPLDPRSELSTLQKAALGMAPD